MDKIRTILIISFGFTIVNILQGNNWIGYLFSLGIIPLLTLLIIEIIQKKKRRKKKFKEIFKTEPVDTRVLVYIGNDKSLNKGEEYICHVGFLHDVALIIGGGFSFFPKKDFITKEEWRDLKINNILKE